MTKFETISDKSNRSLVKTNFRSEEIADSGRNRQELERRFTQYSELLVGYLRKAFGDGPPDPEDVVQETFRKLAEHEDLSSIKHFRAFLWRMARNTVLNERRHSDVRSRHDYEIEQLFFAIEGPDKSPERVLEVRQQLEIINRALTEMPVRRRECFIYHRVDGLSFAAIGRKLSISPRAVVKHVSRAVKDIQRALRTGESEDAS